MDLYIESLSGTVFEVRVSPYETVLAVKAKLQRMEGIPISQQHLIWNNHELNDDLCLQDYLIPSGSKLKLVLGMRGGPINTRRILIPPDDPPVADASSGRHVTLVVLRDGEQLEFYKLLGGGGGGGGSPLAAIDSAGSRAALAAIDSAGSRAGWIGSGSRSRRDRDSLQQQQRSDEPPNSGRALQDKMKNLQQEMKKVRLDRQARAAAAAASTATSAETAVSASPVETILQRPVPPPPPLPLQRTYRRLPPLLPPPATQSEQASAAQTLPAPSQRLQQKQETPPPPPPLRPSTGRLLAGRAKSGLRLPPMPPAEPIGGASAVDEDAKTASSPARCAACKKRTGPATTYGCRCGFNYCTKHRYPEAHACTFDFKSEGRRLLREANPLVAASKLPKI